MKNPPDYTAEDFTQTVFLKLWEQRFFIDADKKLDPYLFTIARNFSLSDGLPSSASQLNSRLLRPVLRFTLCSTEHPGCL
ncbi:MAG: hypothetical protein LBU37_15155 [Tannerellaceae bacterium]|nr:hypothetical protein [Tannerellaceae bacterium]